MGNFPKEVKYASKKAPEWNGIGMAQTGDGLDGISRPLPLQCFINPIHGVQKKDERLHSTTQRDQVHPQQL